MRAIASFSAAVKATQGPEVLLGVGAFGGLYDAMRLKNMNAPVLVSSTDGVGTKVLLAARLGRFDGIGEDLVNHCINDILVQGAQPLFFMDYIAAGTLDPEAIARVVTSAARACQNAGCALLGGETAEMPGVYRDGAFDVVGTIVGAIERGAIIDGSTVTPGDVVLALPSSGLHTNGFSLARKIFERDNMNGYLEELGMPLADALLAPHRCYLSEINRVIDAGVTLKALVHVTGGGLYDNPPRVLPSTCALRFNRQGWRIPPLFQLMQRRGRVSDEEMARVFNMGLGMLLILSPNDAPTATTTLGDEVLHVGDIIARGDHDPPVQWTHR